MSGPEPQPGILDIALYKGGKSAIEGANRVTKLSSNENPFGPSPKAKDAVREIAETLQLYPPDDHFALRTAISDIHGLDAERIICGAGSDEIIALLCNAYAGPGDHVLHTEHGFLMYGISARAAGATPIIAPETDRTTDIDALIDAITDETKLLFIANPNNPTGTMVDIAALTRLTDATPDHCILVIDGAYAEFVEDEEYDAGKRLVETRENVVMTRTFSKIYGLGGMRVGYGYAPKKIIEVLNRVRGPFNVSAAGLVAAEAAVRDTKYTANCVTANAKWREWLRAELAKSGVPSDESAGNFILARFADEAEAVGADKALQKGGILVRRVGAYGLPNCLRITIGDEDACRRVAKFVAEFKSK